MELTHEFKEIATGIQVRRLPSDFAHVRIHYTANPLKRGDWAAITSARYGGMDSPLWQREQEISYNAYTGQRLWPMLSNDHMAEYDVFDGHWAIFRSIDQGIRHPTVCVWIAINKYGDRHVFREFYSVGRSIAENCRLIRGIDRDEPIVGSIIDPSTKKRNEINLTPLIDVFAENQIFAEPADNSFVGYDRVNQMLMSTLARKKLAGNDIPILDKFKLNNSLLKELSTVPALTFDTRFSNRVFLECSNLRWQESKGDQTQTRPKEKPVDVNDDGADCVRYACQTKIFYKEPKKTKFNMADYWKLKQENLRLNEMKLKSKARAYA